MQPLAPPPLDYHETPRRGGRLAVASVCVGAGSFLVTVGVPLTMELFSSLGPVGSPADPRLLALLAAAAVALFGPVVGVTLGALGLRKNMRRRRMALLGVLLNVALWAVFAFLLLSRR